MITRGWEKHCNFASEIFKIVKIMANVKELMIRKPSLKYRDVRNYEGEYYDWAAGEHLLKKGSRCL